MVLAVTACSSSDRPAPGERPESPRPPTHAPAPDVPAGTLGTNVEFGRLSVLNVYLLPDSGGDFRKGTNARVRFTVINRGSTEEALTAVGSPAAAAVTLHWDRSCDGTAEQVSRLPLPAENGVPVVPGASGVRHGPYYAELSDLRRDVLATTLPTAFTFVHAGTVTVAAKVHHPTSGEAPAPLECLDQVTEGGR
ncbi:copper chaperone PCu(A)C [Amycolatopsis tolypomycina]|uniref:copper chaperone PCu(A)C n=1 Tax=Amycolatopsis tolypomycina TaxID=208445 RepID=UPI00339FD1B6